MRTKVFSLALFALLSVLPREAAGAAPDGIDGTRRLGLNGAEFAHVMDILVAGDFAYASIGLGSGFQAYDISDPAGIVRVSTGGFSAWRAWADGDTAYSFCRENGVQVYDISGGPGVLIGGFNPMDGDVHHEGGVRVGDSLFVAAHQKGLHILDVSDIGAILGQSFVTLADNAAWNVAESGGYLFIANGRHGLSVVSLSGTPAEAAVLALPGLANDIVISGDHAFLSLGGDGIASVDISNPETPALDDLVSTLGNAWGIGLVGNILVAGSYPYLERFDVSDPTDIALAGWDATQVYAMGADAGVLSNGDTVIAVADWRGISVYAPEPDPAGDIEVYPLRLDYGQVEPGAPRDTTVTVRNNGAGTLTVNKAEPPSGITVVPDSFQLGPGETLQVLVSAKTTNPLRDRIRWLSDDPDESVFTQYVYKSNGTFPQVGSVAPDFTLQGTDHENHSLSDYRGKVVFLEFGASW